MRISLISLVSESAKAVDWYLQGLTQQDNQDFEVILCLNKDSQTPQVFEVIAKHKSFFKQRLVVIFNSKLKSYQHNLISAFRIAQGNYLYVLNSDATIKRYYVDSLIKLTLKNDADVIEFQPRIIGSINWKPAHRLSTNEVVNLNENKQALAYSFPFIFNKIFKKSLTDQLIKYKPIIHNDSKLCVEVTYMLLLSANTYKYINERIIREYYGANVWLNIKNELQSFQKIENHIKFHNLKVIQEIMYAKYYYFKIIMYGLLNSTTFVYRNFKSKEQIKEKRSMLLVQKHEATLQKLQNTNEFEQFEKSNVYMLKASIETNLLRSEISQLKKVKAKILSELE
ncbi:glycosyltransferase [Mycoplasmopsis citelli]|uniref:Glycosyl transferase family 2 n=1 Tax=Mycoplasmopsis citelli TaxID=171281 RepID=A0A449B0Y6_9BACT|nr:glycosyltransferase [Mycoplasmopsis citelli]UUD36630.1 glycosyltransferase [Mycoplasmopsis citelli]VEU74269.1 Glycosyl transferase family 2 [Mycoplasmopsis citelli]